MGDKDWFMRGEAQAGAPPPPPPPESDTLSLSKCRCPRTNAVNPRHQMDSAASVKGRADAAS